MALTFAREKDFTARHFARGAKIVTRRSRLPRPAALSLDESAVCVLSDDGPIRIVRRSPDRLKNVPGGAQASSILVPALMSGSAPRNRKETKMRKISRIQARAGIHWKRVGTIGGCFPPNRM
jgi:hypothetical protein